MTKRVKIKFTKDAVLFLKDKKEVTKIKKDTIMFADELRATDFGSFANVTDKKIKETKEDKKEDKKSK